ncbi:hypothetical protein EGW08_021780 [Elysia chlorotica]|uniref:Pyruvate kinase C-terminal domain-containing protein n=1 Tax=Elysia chlorotica TaxID=188477 RepID=A0A3S0ZAH6_ELYCH|nr:hypothetical protein EGW08_021780 [Elysia chlorotica]
MSELCLEAESAFKSRDILKELKAFVPHFTDFSRAAALGAVSATHQGSCAAIIALASQVSTVYYLSNYRPRCPIVYVTRDEPVARQCLLLRAVTPYLLTTPPLPEWDKDVSMRVEEGMQYGAKQGFINNNDTVVILMALTSEQGRHCSVQIVTYS